MWTRIWIIMIAFLAFGFADAGNGLPYEQTIQKMLDSLDKITVELVKIVDEESALAAKPELRKEATVWLGTRAKAAKLQPPEKDEKARLEKLYKPKLDESLKKLFTQRP